MDNQIQTDFVRPAFEPDIKIEPRVTPKQTPAKLKETNIGNVQVTPEMPVAIFDELLATPVLAHEWRDIEILFRADLSGSREKIQQIDAWIKSDLEKSGYKLTVGAYKEYLEQVKKTINYSPNRVGIETLDQIYHYLKNISHKKVKK